MKKLLFALFAILSGLTSFSQNALDYGRLPSHPRLFMRAGDEKAIKKMLKSKENRYLLESHYHCFDIADKALSLPVFKWPGEGHILSTSRNTLCRIINLCYAYRMTGSVAYAKRAEEELLNVCVTFPHWDPDHWLDTAEMMTAVAIGYDWLFDFLEDDARQAIEQAIIEKGLNQVRKFEFYKSKNNWNSVCNAGTIAGALAVYEKDPGLARDLINLAVSSNPLVMTGYGPDGVYPEGYSYWSYGTGYEVLLITMLEECLGSSCGLADYPGFLQSASWLQHMCTPTGHTFSYSDSGSKANLNLMLFWFSRRLRDPSLVYLEKQTLMAGNVEYGIEDRFLPLMMVWAAKQDLSGISAPADKVWSGDGEIPVFIYRSGWDSPEDTYLAVKGGRPDYSHGHMDGGEFYFEKGGVIWAADMGGQSYGTFYKNNVQNWDFSQDGDRWGIWRNCTLMHNTITVNNGRHLARGRTSISSVIDTDGIKGCNLDMDEALSLQLESCRRSVLLSDGDNVLTVTDTITAKPDLPADVYWNLLTYGEPGNIVGNVVTLSKSKKKLNMTVESENAGKIEVKSSKSPFSWDVPNPGTCRIGFNVPVSAGQTKVIKVIFKYSEE